jgi:hypothetical protein
MISLISVPCVCILAPPSPTCILSFSHLILSQRLWKLWSFYFLCNYLSVIFPQSSLQFLTFLLLLGLVYWMICVVFFISFIKLLISFSFLQNLNFLAEFLIQCYWLSSPACELISFLHLPVHLNVL